MCRIYASAHHVLVWLGKSDAEIDAAMDLINTRDDGKTLKERYPIWNDEKRCSVKPGIQKFLKKPWWSRLWVVQETVVPKLGPRFYCGRRWVPWDAISNLIDALIAAMMGDRPDTDTIQQDDAYLLYHFKLLRTSWHDEQEQHNTDSFGSHLERDKTAAITLQGLLLVSSGRSASDPRDHVFAILGLVLNQQSSIRVDYSESASTVYQAAMLEAMKSSTTELLYHALVRHGEVD